MASDGRTAASSPYRRKRLTVAGGTPRRVHSRPKAVLGTGVPWGAVHPQVAQWPSEAMAYSVSAFMMRRPAAREQGRKSLLPVAFSGNRGTFGLLRAGDTAGSILSGRNSRQSCQLGRSAGQPVKGTVDEDCRRRDAADREHATGPLAAGDR